MKKYGLIFAVVMFLGVSAFAQGGSAYLSVLPGYQFSSSEVDSGYVMSLDGGYFYDDNWAVHVGLNYNEGQFDFGDYPVYYGSSWYMVDGRFKDSFYIFELGPELNGSLGKGQIYWQIVNVGHTFGAENNEWTLGTAAGYRYPINESVGVNFQTSYHRVYDWDTNHWDMRLGLIFRF